MDPMDGRALTSTCPFPSPHHTISDAGLIGGGTTPKPSEVRLDRIDIQVEVPAMRYDELADQSAGEASSAIRARVDRAHEMQLARFHGHEVFCNA